MKERPLHNHEVYAIKRYGDLETAFFYLSKQFFIESTGDPSVPIPDNPMAYTPAIERKKNETLGDYRVRQLDYWLKHTKIVKLPWYRRIKIINREKLLWN